MQDYRAASLFQPSNLAKAIEQTMDPSSGAAPYLFGSIISIPHTIVARTVAVLGQDFIMVDAQHTPIDAENLVRIIQTINLSSEGKTVAVVRVPSARSDLLTYALDAGAGGIIFPHIDTPEQAAEAVSKCRYAYSDGDRSLAPAVLVPGVTDVAPPGSSHERIADKHIAVIIQIESPLALDNADAIASIPGVSSLMLGVGDLRVAMKLPSRAVDGKDEPILLDAIDRLVGVSRRHRMPLAVVAFKLSAASSAWLKDFQLLLTTADFLCVVKGHREDLARIKGALAEITGGPPDGALRN
ncbi:HpcH/HpaI aldolase/citrate lyase family protein [Aspergillus leporis]|uniref:HpcH/HpaI aldolase/citrate lyase family protein n=1 Tax=Aspergillus leporis TaxID=41062 RepID=A0A5N5X585_9EURO|nr:HpcH/HpaI aldolase/citrate lyase family protein [Aspergillus leporis]